MNTKESLNRHLFILLSGILCSIAPFTAHPLLADDLGDSCALATPIALNSTNTTAIVLEGMDDRDTDTLQLPLDAPGVLVIEDAGTNLTASLFPDVDCDDEEATVGEVRLGPRHRIVAIVEGHDYFLRLRSYNGDEGNYTLRLRFFADCEPRQPGQGPPHGFTCRGQGNNHRSSPNVIVLNSDQQDETQTYVAEGGDE